jgi:hypothetical protein
MKKYLCFLLNVTAFSFCLSVSAQNVKPEAVDNNSLTDEEVVQKTIFVDLLENAGEKIKIYFFAVNNGKNPGKNLLAELKKIEPKGFESNAAIVENGEARDIKSGELGILFSIGNLKRTDENTVETYAYSSTGNVSSVGCDYILKRASGVWRIFKKENCTIS